MRSRRDLLVLGLVLVAAVVLVGLHVHDFRTVSHIDETQHLDYYLKSPWHVVRHGETLGVEAMSEVACRGIDYPQRLAVEALFEWVRQNGDAAVAQLSPEKVVTVRLPACGSELLEPWMFPNSGINTASAHPLIYYTTTALAAEAVDAVAGVDSPVTAGRLVGIGWLAAAVVLLWWALGSLGAGTWAKAVAVGLLVVSPLVLHQSATVTPDATALLAGALLLAVVLRWEAARAPTWLVALVALVAVWLKFTNAAAVGAVIVYLLVRVWQQRDRARQYLPLAAVLGVLAVGSLVIWSAWQESRGLIGAEQLPTNAVFAVDSFQWHRLGDELFSTLTPLRDTYVPDTLPRSWLEPLSDVANLLVLAGLGSAALVTARRSAHRSLAMAAAVGMVAMGVVTMISSYLSVGAYFETNPRYGLSLLPFALAAGVPVLTWRPARWGVGAVVLATGGAVLAGLVT